MSIIKNKGVGTIIAAVAAVVALVGLILYGVYIGNGGAMNTLALGALIVGILLELSLLFLNGDLSDLAAIIAPVLFVSGAALELGDGIGNLTDWITGVICFGNMDLAPSNITITAVLMVSVLIGIIACFTHKGQKQ